VDVNKIILELREEQSRVIRAIEAIEALAVEPHVFKRIGAKSARRGRPPGSRNKPKSAPEPSPSPVLMK
jgi:hypothetical protein